MEKRFRGRGLWIGLAVLGILFLCFAMFGAGAMMFTARSGTVYMQPPAGEEAVAPPAPYYGHGPLGRHGGWGPFGIIGFGIGLIFKLLFFGLLLVLLLGLVKRIFLGPRHWGWAPHWGRPPKGKEGEDKPHEAWGPRAWHRHFAHWGPPGSSACWGPEAKVSAEEGESDDAESEYSGPQE
ncbi:MAG: hypothetical protein PVH17_07470 [Anaerolineae bacterium]|jgi:hypothetical protein